MARAIGILGYVLLVSGFIFIVFGYGSVLYFEGFAKLQEVMSPFNVWNFISVCVTLAPGYLLIRLSEKLRSSD
ncbi:hypothetical protein BJF95_01340 [Rhizobium oryziradicis]|uniref:Uncharacterized protein n=1 Tax=Rhizobium oryziradicis TaxID=1867956 RepID=A0A1Q8ZLX6_9HYPH|nr:hypothetical protein BJF95_01340 [Rhizobium oryziradicis]